MRGLGALVLAAACATTVTTRAPTIQPAPATWEELFPIAAQRLLARRHLDAGALPHDARDAPIDEGNCTVYIGGADANGRLKDFIYECGLELWGLREGEVVHEVTVGKVLYITTWPLDASGVPGPPVHRRRSSTMI